MLELIQSQPFLTVLSCWLAAKTLKTLIRLAKGTKKEDILDAGGFPSEHTAIVASLFFVTAFETNWDPVLSTITLFVSMIVMYDAMGVRYQAGLHGQLLNKLDKPKEFANMVYKESIGHKFIEVAGGVLTALIICLISYQIF